MRTSAATGLSPGLAESGAATASGRIRPFRAEDIPDVVALRRRAYRYSERPDSASLEAYCERIFCRRDNADDDLPSLVHEDAHGRLTGFLGVIPHRMVFRAEGVRLAVATQMMVAPEARGIAGLGLVRAFFAGPQDVSLSDTANDAARRLWEGLGGYTSTIHSLTWRLPLRRRGLPAWASPRAVRVPPPGSVEPLDPAAVAAEAPRLLRHFALKPAYPTGDLAWLLRRAAEKPSGVLRGGMVRDHRGEVAGWFLYYLRPGRTSHVLHVAARSSTERIVFGHLVHDAWRLDATAVSGRLDPSIVAQVGVLDCEIRHDGPWTLLHARNPDLLDAVIEAKAFLSRLEGEWWLSF